MDDVRMPHVCRRAADDSAADHLGLDDLRPDVWHVGDDAEVGRTRRVTHADAL